MNKTFRKNNLIILSILLILLPIFIQRSINTEMRQFNEDKGVSDPKTSGVYANILIDDSPGSLTNWAWATTQPWFGGGLGTPEEPYIIEYQTFIYSSGGGGEGLAIINSNKNFIIRYCIFMNSHPSWSGLILWNVTNGQILDNDVYNNGGGIVLYETNNTIISDNYIYNSKFLDGIFAEYSHSNTFSGNTVFNSTENGIDLKHCNFNTISGNQIFNNILDGILIELSDINTLLENTIYNNSDNGIWVDNSDSNKLSGNLIYNNSINGIYVDTSDFNNLSKNEVNYNSESGIYLGVSHNTTILRNNANHNEKYGIYLYTSNDNNFTVNTANNNAEDGIHIDKSHHNNILANIIDNNKHTGIYLYFDSKNNTISNNNIKNNTLYGGILIDDNCDYNNASDNIIEDNPCGIYIAESDKNSITKNILNNNTWGIYIDSGSDNNSFYENFLLKNDKHAFDNGEDNKWNSTTIGNYWDNHTAPDEIPPVGIVDNQYNISGPAGSIDYLPIAEDGVPNITIYSPITDNVFGINAPSYVISITESHLFEMWYTLDGGIHNYICTGFTGTINKLAWTAAPEGNVTIRFYASDKPGNIGTAEVMIVKDFEAPLIDIKSPTSGKIFGNNTPSFNVRITDDFLDTMWYTLDGGLHNYTFTTNGTIEQAAWNDLADGSITLRFYASDDLDHIGSAEVSIIKDTVAPVIIINSPIEGEKYGNNAPLFNITIIEQNLDLTWYSLDGGLTNYTIIDNGTFDQTAWTNLSQGAVNITFYAKDLAGNKASESVTVIKSIPAGDGGLNPGVIIAIVIVSVVGGVAIVAVVYFFMKKRAIPE